MVCLKETCIAGADTLLGPEMRSTGEVMGIDSDFSKAYAKAALSAGQKLPVSGNVFVSMTDKFKEAIVPIAKELKAMLIASLSFCLLLACFACCSARCFSNSARCLADSLQTHAWLTYFVTMKACWILLALQLVKKAHIAV